MAAESREIVLTRVFDAPCERVFDAWTDPSHIAEWWGPRGFRTTVFTMDVRPGGVWRFILHGPRGVDHPNKIVYSEVVRPSRLVYSHGGDDERDPNHFDVTVTFADEGGKTRLTMRSEFASAAERDRVVNAYGALEGGHQTLDRLGELLTQDRRVDITRVFDAPRELVFSAWTDPEQLVRWYAPAGCTIHYSKINVHPGGTFHSCVRTGNGDDCWCRGVYREIVKPERIVYTLAVADENGSLAEPAAIGMDPDWPAETIVTVTFAERGGRTTLNLQQTVLESLAHRTGAHRSWIEMLDGLADELTLRIGGRR